MGVGEGGRRASDLVFFIFMFSVRWLGSARCPALAPSMRFKRHGVLLSVAKLQYLWVSPCLVTGPSGRGRSPCRVAGGRSSGGCLQVLVFLARLSLLLLGGHADCVLCLVTGPSGRVAVAGGRSSGQAVAKTGSKTPSLAGVDRGQRGGLWSRQLVAGHPSASRQKEAVASGDGRQPRALGVWGALEWLWQLHSRGDASRRPRGP